MDWVKFTFKKSQISPNVKAKFSDYYFFIGIEVFLLFVVIYLIKIDFYSTNWILFLILLIGCAFFFIFNIVVIFNKTNWRKVIDVIIDSITQSADIEAIIVGLIAFFCLPIVDI